MLIDIATANNRRQGVWNNRTIAWNDLIVRLSRTQRTAESYAVYLDSDKQRQDEIKDIGGFVGGYLNDGKRKKRNVRHRQLLTLDVDYATESFWEDFLFQYKEAALVYSTHKHAPDSPRLRLVMPLSRKCTPEEYEALARRIAGDIDIELFDPTTFQSERLMYWPSTAKDGDWYFRVQEGEWLDVDAVLGRYINWKDISAWPRTIKDKAVHARDIKKQGEPTDKPGPVGAFCRAYDIPAAIAEFLPDTYEATDFPDRYSYAEGSTSSGAIVYEDKFLYSHHSTDPIHGHLVNSFDLVRLHRFGDLDLERDKDKPISQQQSYIAMCELAVADPNVVREIDDFKKPIEEALFLESAESDDPEDEPDSVESDFMELLGIEEEDVEPEKGVTSENWKSKMTRQKKSGKVEPTISNLKLIMLFDAELEGKIALNEFENYIYAMGPLPWDPKNKKKRRWTDADDSGLREYLETRYGIYHIGKAIDATILAAVHNRFHPVREYLNDLEWDGVSRLDTLLIDYLGAEDSDYVRAVTRKAFAAAVARIYHPGCKFDYVLTLVGPEGLKKSGLLAEMGGKWFSDSFQTVSGKEAYEQLQGAWVIEIAELAGFNKAETNSIKGFVTKRTDRYRAAYGKHVQEWPRQSVFFATTNEPVFLKGHTGNRRFWPVSVTKRHEPEAALVNSVDSEREVIVGLPVDQLWAEAKYWYKEGEPLYLEKKEVEDKAKEIQEEYSELDERIGLVMKYLETKLPENWKNMLREERRAYLWDHDEIKAKGTVVRDSFCIPEIWCECLGQRLEDMTAFAVRPLHQMLAALPGWKRKDSTKVFPIYGRQRYYGRIEKTETVA